MPVTNARHALFAQFCAAGLALFAAHAAAAGLADTIRAVKPAVVGIGTVLTTRSPPVIFFGTGFAVGDGLTIVTNAHVLAPIAVGEKAGKLIVLVGQGADYQQREAQIITADRNRDLALLKIAGPPLPALTLGDSTKAAEGQALAFTGYPLAMALGLHAATHRATLSAITPIVRPPANARHLNAATAARVRDGPFAIFQLDGTAYPGNSGSPLYDAETGEVMGIVNMVFVKGAKENALTNPSGISYAIPSQYIKAMLAKNSAKNSGG